MNQLVTIEPGALGADYVSLTPKVKAWLLTNHARFVIRYIARRSSIGKIITTAEIKWLHANGIAIALNYEGSTNDLQSGAPGGVANGSWSRQFVRSLGYPEPAPLFVSVDTDVYAGNLGTAKAYVQGFIGQIGAHHPAVYGDTDILAAVKPLRPIGWLPNARAWSDPTDGAIVHIKQGREDKQYGVDPNVCLLPFQAWLPHDDKPEPPQPPEDSDMGKLFQADDGDTAEFVVAGGVARWVRSGENRRHLQFAGLCAQGVNKCGRAFFRELSLVGGAPVYPPNYNGPRTVATDFGG